MQARALPGRGHSSLQTGVDGLIRKTGRNLQISEPGRCRGVNKDKNKGVRRCAKFRQTLGSDQESVDMTLTNQCKFEVLCSIEWDLQCAPSLSTSSADKGKKATTLDYLESWDITASASPCALDWEIKNVRWRCVATEG